MPPKAKAVGWDWFNQLDDDVSAARERAQRSAEDMQMAYTATFSTPAGQVVADDLRRFLLRVKSWDPNLDFYRAAGMGFYREGQNSMVAYIEEMTARGRKL